MAEEYVVGKEYSVEAISYNGKHEVIQITEKIGSGAPHFVELEHHQPATLLISVENKIKLLIPQILSAISFTNGASHTEIKIDDNENLYLIEVNPRGGGDYISNILVGLSTDCDYLKQMILVALDMYEPIAVHNTAYAGVYFLSAYTDRLLPYFDIPKEEWMVMRERTGKELTFSCSNYDRNGFILYSSNKKLFYNETILIFGATGTLGAYISLHFHKLGYRVLAVGHRKSDNGFLQIIIFPIIRWIFQKSLISRICRLKI